MIKRDGRVGDDVGRIETAAEPHLDDRRVPAARAQDEGDGGEDLEPMCGSSRRVIGLGHARDGFSPAAHRRRTCRRPWRPAGSAPSAYMRRPSGWAAGAALSAASGAAAARVRRRTWAAWRAFQKPAAASGLSGRRGRRQAQARIRRPVAHPRRDGLGDGGHSTRSS